MSEGLGSETTSSRSEPVKHISRLFGWLLVVALLAVPVAVISGDDLTVVSLWGFVSASSSGIVDGYPVWAYFLDQPRPFGALPASIGRGRSRSASTCLRRPARQQGGRVRREDRRVTGGLLTLAAAASLWVSVGVATRFGVGTTSGWLAVIPVGALATRGRRRRHLRAGPPRDR